MDKSHREIQKEMEKIRVELERSALNYSGLQRRDVVKLLTYTIARMQSDGISTNHYWPELSQLYSYITKTYRSKPKKVKSIFEWVTRATGNNPVRPQFGVVNVVSDRVMVATDGIRLHIGDNINGLTPGLYSIEGDRLYDHHGDGDNTPSWEYPPVHSYFPENQVTHHCVATIDDPTELVVDGTSLRCCVDLQDQTTGETIKVYLNRKFLVDAAAGYPISVHAPRGGYPLYVTVYPGFDEGFPRAVIATMMVE